MEIHYISGEDRRKEPLLFRKLFEARHRVFVQTRAWTLPSRANVEIDEYDVPEAQYFYGFDEAGAVVSHLRLTPTTTHSLMADYFPHLLEPGQSARRAGLYEATRYITPSSVRTRSAYKKAKAELLVAMLKWCLKNEVTEIQAVIDASALNHYLEAMPATFPLGLAAHYAGGPGVHGGGEALAVRCAVNGKTIRDVQAYGGLNQRLKASPDDYLHAPS